MHSRRALEERDARLTVGAIAKSGSTPTKTSAHQKGISKVKQKRQGQKSRQNEACDVPGAICSKFGVLESLPYWEKKENKICKETK